MPDLTEQFALPDVAPPMLLKLLEAIERKGEQFLFKKKKKVNNCSVESMYIIYLFYPQSRALIA